MDWIITDKQTFSFNMRGTTEMERYRADSFFEKEPETIAWIRTFNPQGVFIDVGANIGVYSLYAASLYPEMTVVACEPVYANFMRLVENIEMNGFKNIIPLPVAVGSATLSINDLFIKSGGIGDSGSQIRRPVDEHGKEYKAIAQQKVICMCIGTVNKLIGRDANYIKVDIDGGEQSVIWGLPTGGGGKSIKSILVEVNKCKTSVRDIASLLSGFEIDHSFDGNHSNQRRGGNPENVIWRRKYG